MALADRVKILMVEDSEELLAVWKILFASCDEYSVETVSSGYAAIEVMERGFIPDLLVTDFYLGDLTGLDLHKECRGRNPNVAVLMITGNGDDDRLVRMVAKGEIELMVKPVKFDTIRERVSEMISQQMISGFVGPQSQ